MGTSAMSKFVGSSGAIAVSQGARTVGTTVVGTGFVDSAALLPGSPQLLLVLPALLLPSFLGVLALMLPGVLS